MLIRAMEFSKFLVRINFADANYEYFLCMYFKHKPPVHWKFSTEDILVMKSHICSILAANGFRTFDIYRKQTYPAMHCVVQTTVTVRKALR